MNILHITRQFYPIRGGVETFIYEISKRLIAKGVNSRILTLDYNIVNKRQKFSSYEIFEGIEIFRVHGIGYYKRPVPLHIPLRLFKWADIIHIHDLRIFYESVFLLKFFFGYKIVFSTHGFFLHTDDLRLIKAMMIPFYYKPTIKTVVDFLFCHSQPDFSYFKKWNMKNIRFIEYGADFEKFNAIKRKPVKGKLLYFGRVEKKNKRLDLLFEALAFLKDSDWSLHIAGGGFEGRIQRLKSMAYELGISGRIVWHGTVTQDELFNLLAESQLCFFPSQYESFGYTLVEAMASGNICVANKIVSYESVIEDEKNGFLVDFSRSKKSYQSIKRLLERPLGTFDNISRLAKEKAKKYDWEDKIEQIKDIYQILNN